MNEGELEIKVYKQDTGYGKIVLRTIDGAVYLGENIQDTLKLIEDFIKERMGK